MAEKGFFAWLLSDPGNAALAGALGGMVRWVTLRDSWKEGVPALLVGAVCAVYVAPFIEPIIGPAMSATAPDADVGALTAFLTGLGGIGIAGFILDLISSRLTKGGRNGKR